MAAVDVLEVEQMLRNVAFNIGIIRRNRGMSAKQLAKACGFAEQTVLYAEGGSRAPSLATICAISMALGKPLDYFFRDPAFPYRDPEMFVPVSEDLPQEDSNGMSVEVQVITKECIVLEAKLCFENMMWVSDEATLDSNDVIGWRTV